MVPLWFTLPPRCCFVGAGGVLLYVDIDRPPRNAAVVAKSWGAGVARFDYEQESTEILQALEARRGLSTVGNNIPARKRRV